MSSSSTAAAKVGVEHFDWMARFEAHPEERPSPEEAFRHVEESLDTGVRRNMIVEMPLDAGHSRFWLARVDEVFGPLLKITLVPESETIVYDLSKRRIFPLGYCQMNKKSLVPSDEIQKRCPDWEQLAIRYLEDASFDTVSMHFIDGDGVTPLDRIKIGMVVDVRSGSEPSHFWPAIVRENRGGLLRLSYLTSDKISLNLFYLSDRLFRKDDSRAYTPPDGITCTGEVAKELLGVRRRVSPPADLFETYSSAIEKAGFADGSAVEVIEGDAVVRATVEATGKYTFCFRKEGDTSGTRFVRSIRSCGDVFPVGWFDGSGPGRFEPAEKAGFAPGQKLEFQKDLDDARFEIHTATIRKIRGHVLVLEADGDGGNKFLVPANSLRVFPVGWANANHLLLTVPTGFAPKEQWAETESEGGEGRKEEEEEEEESYWCPPIFFNYRCYSASFLSKARLAGLPQSVGPGPVKLVMREVLNLLIGSSFKSGSVLKRFQTGRSIPRKDFVMDELKGKSRVLVLKANVEIPTKRCQVDKFCKDVCAKVNACPFLISTERYDNVMCPADCRNRPKADFKEDEEKVAPPGMKSKASAGGHGKSKKRRNPDKLLLEEERVKRMDGWTSSGDESGGDGRTTAASSRTQSRSNSPDSASGEQPKQRRYGRKEWRSLLPKSEMRTRGAKQPDWKLHFMVRPSFREREALEAEKSKLAKDRRVAADGGCYTYHDRHVMEPVVLPTGSGKRSTKRLELPPAFSMSAFPEEEDGPEPSPPKRSSPLPPPPIRRIRLKTNPEHWSVNDTAKFLAQTADCSHLARFMKEDSIDGQAFLMLNYPTVKDYWQLKASTAIKLCQHVESVRLSHVTQFSF